MDLHGVGVQYPRLICLLLLGIIVCMEVIAVPDARRSILILRSGSSGLCFWKTAGIVCCQDALIAWGEPAPHRFRQSSLIVGPAVAGSVIMVLFAI